MPIHFGYRIGKNQPRIIYRCLAAHCGTRQYTPGVCHMCGGPVVSEGEKGTR